MIEYIVFSCVPQVLLTIFPRNSRYLVYFSVLFIIVIVVIIIIAITITITSVVEVRFWERFVYKTVIAHVPHGRCTRSGITSGNLSENRKNSA